MLKFYAKDGHTVPVPNSNVVGQRRRYIGRKTIVKRDESGAAIEIGHPADPEGFSCDPDSDVARRLKRLFSIEEEAPLWPADKETAAALGVKFVPVELKDGEFSVVAAASVAKKGSDK